METNEDKSSVAVKEQPEQGNNDCMVLDKPQKQSTFVENAAKFRDEVAKLTRELLGEDKSMAFASGVIAGLELIRNGTDPWLNSVLELPEEVESIP